MAGPPKDVKASELWRKLASRGRPTVTVDYPAKDADGEPLGQVAIWTLRVEELHACRANADKVAKEKLGGEFRVGDLGYEEIYREELMAQLLALAVRQADDTAFPHFPSPAAARSVISDELAVLMNAYNEHSRKSGPIISEMTKDELAAWTTRLQEGAGQADPLSFLASEAKSDLIWHLVSLLPKSPEDSGSAGSLPDTSSTENRSDATRAIDEA